jgi:uracil-DNA glycosylase
MMPGVSAQDFVPESGGLAGLRTAAAGCRACELWEQATQTVFSAGPADARLVLVGEQPGDQEDKQGAPFVGPAGRLLVKAVDEAGIPRDAVYRTNAVKHFRFTQAGPASGGSTRRRSCGTSPPAGRGWSRSCGSSTPRWSSASGRQQCGRCSARRCG